MADLRLQVILTALDKVTAPLKKIQAATKPTSHALKETSNRLKELNVQQKALNQFRDLHQGLSTTTAKLNTAQSSVNRLAKALRETEKPTRAMTREFNDAVKTARSLKTEHAQQSQQLQHLRDRLSNTGISTGQLGQAEISLRNSIRQTNAELTSQQAKLTAVATHQQRVASAKRQAEKWRNTSGHLAIAGATALVAGKAASTPLTKGLHEAKHYQTEAGRIASLGLGQQVNTEAQRYARQLSTYGTSHLDNLELVRDSMSIFGDLPHAQMVVPTLAKMKFGNKAFYGEEEGGENERQFMDMLKVIEVRGGLTSSEKFHHQANMVQKVIAATGGRVGPNEWLNMIKTGGLAAKGMDDASFYYQMEPMVQELSGYRVGTGLTAAYNNLYQGRTSKRAALNLEKLGLIGDHSKVTYDKAGQTAQLNPGALLGSDLFKKSQFDWMEQVLLPQLAKKGITEKGHITDTLGSIFSNGRAADLYGNMFLQRNQIHKNAKLNAGASDIEQLTELGKQQTNGKELEVTAKLADLKLALGEKILPVYTDAIIQLTESIKNLNHYIEANPALSKALFIALGTIAAVAMALGATLLVLSPLIASYALLYVCLAKLGVTGGVLLPLLKGIGAALIWLGNALLITGRALLMNPLGLAITAIALSALLIYKYWEPIKAFFVNLWAGIKSTFHGAMDWFASLPSKFTEFGSRLMQGLINGITGALSKVKDTVMNAGANVISWFKEKLGIHSPSRVFTQLGEYTMQGLTIGLQRGEPSSINQISDLAKRIAQLGAGMAIGTTAMAFNTGTPLSSGLRSPSSSMQGDTIHITIHPSASMDERAVANEVARILESRDRQKAARRRSSYSVY